jgi:hypothetical protein
MGEPDAWGAVIRALWQVQVVSEQNRKPAEMGLAAQVFLGVLAHELWFEGSPAEAKPKLEQDAVKRLIAYLDGEAAKPDAGTVWDEAVHNDLLLLSATAQTVLTYVKG